MNISLQSSESNGWNSDKTAGHLTVPLRSLAMGKEVTINIPATNVSSLETGWEVPVRIKMGSPGPQGIPTFPSGLRIF